MQRLSPSRLLAAVCTLAACSGTESAAPRHLQQRPAGRAVRGLDRGSPLLPDPLRARSHRRPPAGVRPQRRPLRRAGSQIVALLDTNGDGVSDASERTAFAARTGRQSRPRHHGDPRLRVVGRDRLSLALQSGIASRPARWRRSSGIPSSGHSTRTLIIDAQNRLYVSIGSASNVDTPAGRNTPPPARAVIRRYALASHSRGRLPGDGRRAVRRRPAQRGRPLHRQQGPHVGRRERPRQPDGRRRDIHFDNPAEEVNLFDINRPGRNYGYPFCWSEGIWMDTAMAKGPGTQHLDPDQPGGFTEAKCQDASVVVPPAFALGAHLAPLDIVEYTGKGYPAAMQSAACSSTSHGSWNREFGQVGRMIVRLKMGANGPTAAENFLGEADAAARLRPGILGDPPGVDPRRRRRPADVVGRRARRGVQDRLQAVARRGGAPRRHGSVSGAPCKDHAAIPEGVRTFPHGLHPLARLTRSRPLRWSSKRGG